MMIIILVLSYCDMHLRVHDEFGHVYDFCTRDSSRADTVYIHKRSIVKYLASGYTVLYCRKSKKAW